MKRSPGRPPLDDDDTSVKVCVTMPSRQYDHLCQRAQRERTTVQDVIRRRLPPPPATDHDKKNI